MESRRLFPLPASFCVAMYNSLITNFVTKTNRIMRSTFKVLFYVNSSKEKNGIVPVMGRVTINGSVASSVASRPFPKGFGTRKATGRKERARRRETSISPLTTSRHKSSNTTNAFQTGKRSLQQKWYATPFKDSVRNTRRCSVHSTRTTRVSGSVSA